MTGNTNDATTDRPKTWVIFDTAATSNRPAYYKDVHDLLALPVGAMCRYNYRRDYLSAAALRLVEQSREIPAVGRIPAILVYWQLPSYQRYEKAPSSAEWANEKALFAVTRLATVHAIVESSREVWLDLELSQYPVTDSSKVASPLISELISSDQTPPLSWVTVAKDRDLWQRLHGEVCSPSALDDRWQKVVDALGTSPMQFAGDVFFRVRNVYTSGWKSTPIKNRVEPRVLRLGGDAMDEAEYVVTEGSTIAVEIATTTPSTVEEPLDGAPGNVTAASSFVSSVVTVTPDAQAHIRLVGGSKVPLRPHGIQAVQLRVSRTEEVSERQAGVNFEAPMQPAPHSDWCGGAGVSLRFRVRKEISVLVASVVLLAAGAWFSFLSVSTPPDHLTRKGAYAAAVTLTVVLSALLGARKIPLRA